MVSIEAEVIRTSAGVPFDTGGWPFVPLYCARDARSSGVSSMPAALAPRAISSLMLWFMLWISSASSRDIAHHAVEFGLDLGCVCRHAGGDGQEPPGTGIIRPERTGEPTGVVHLLVLLAEPVRDLEHVHE